MNPKFLLKEDMIIRLDVAGTMREVKLFDKGKFFEVNESGDYILESAAGITVLSEEEMRSNPLFEAIEQEDRRKVEITIEEVPIDDDEVVKKWKIQIDVTTTRKKLIEIENFINENIKKLL